MTLCQENTDMTFVVSAPVRRPWGQANFRGNCDGTLIKDLMLRYGTTCRHDMVRDVLNLEGPLGQSKAIIIKTQHNCKSDAKPYQPLTEPRIMHEYCVVLEHLF